jgi:hypothetical protein
MSIKASLLLAFVTFIGCVSVAPDTVTADMMNQPPHAMAKRTAASVEVFTAGVPARQRVDVAVLRVVYPTGNIDPMILMRVHAGEMGCDGLVLTHTDVGLSGTCIVYTDTPAAAPEPAPAPTAPTLAPTTP